ncbi:hypothetical protein BsWGS_03729 [Bradybaena similaris]
MSNKSIAESNSSQWSNASSPNKHLKNYFLAAITIDSTIVVAGTVINVWFLAALLLSPEIRARIRNKVVCALMGAHLTEAVIICPYFIVRTTAFYLDTNVPVDCSLQTILTIMYHIQDFVGNWYLLSLLCVFAAQVMNFEPKFTSQWIKILTVSIFVTPCVFSVLFVPITMKSFYLRYSDHRCFFSTEAAVKVFTSLDTAVPLTLSGLLLMATAVLKYRRYPQGRSSDTLREQLIDAGSQIDPLHPFVAILLTVVASDFCTMLMFLDPNIFDALSYKDWLHVYLVFEVLGYLRIILVPVELLLFPDIRKRIKSWRPWRRSALRADVVVTYQRNTS